MLSPTDIQFIIFLKYFIKEQPWFLHLLLLPFCFMSVFSRGDALVLLNTQTLVNQIQQVGKLQQE